MFDNEMFTQERVLYVLKSFEGTAEFDHALEYVCELLDHSPDYVLDLLSTINL